MTVFYERKEYIFMNLKEYLIFAAIAAVVVTIMEVIVPGTVGKLFMGLAAILFVKFWFEN